MQILDEGCLRQKEYCFFNIYVSYDPADFIQKHTHWFLEVKLDWKK